MSTATPRRPSPADMARPRPSVDRALYEQAIRASRMLPHHRLTALALVTHADRDGQIPTDKQPRLVGLIHDTGLRVGQVVIALTALRDRGWIRKARSADAYEIADLVLTIPAPILARLLKPTTTTTTERTATDA